MLDGLSALKGEEPIRVHELPVKHELGQWSNQLICKGEEDLNAEFRRGVTYAYKDHAEAIYDAYVQLMKGAPLVLRTPNRVFLIHSLPVPSRLK
jgi:hypothetical protein